MGNNLRSDATVEVSLKFSKMEGIRYLHSSSNVSTIKVRPRGEGVILMTKDGGYSIAYGDSINVIRSAADLVTIAQQKGTQKPWKARSGETAVIQFSYQHSDGMFYLYKNISRNL